MKKTLKTILVISLTILMSCGDDDTQEQKPNIDLEVTSYELTKVSTSGLGGDVKIKGVIKNIGDDYKSNEGQQAFYLSYRNIGATGLGTVITQNNFTNINSGETIEISYTINNWDAGTEFPADYILYIGYDNDIESDGNEKNDDNKPENDKIIFSGYDINDLFD